MTLMKSRLLTGVESSSEVCGQSEQQFMYKTVNLFSSFRLTISSSQILQLASDTSWLFLILYDLNVILSFSDGKQIFYFRNATFKIQVFLKIRTFILFHTCANETISEGRRMNISLRKSSKSSSFGSEAIMNFESTWEGYFLIRI